MSSPEGTDTTVRSDAELIAEVRSGDTAAYGDLFERHRDAAQRLARQLTSPSDADDLVSDAFAKVLTVLQRGGGPDVAFRAYLLTAVRRLHVDQVRATSRATPTDEPEAFDPGVPFADPALAQFENSAAAKAFAALPERWQLVLWHLEVEEQKPAEIAPLLGISANSVSALAYRAREGLRQSYLQMHLSDTGADSCRWVTERLGARVRDGLSKRETQRVDQHLDECRKCAGVYLELTEVNSDLSGIIAPVLLGTAATGYLASTTGGAAAGAAGGGVVVLWFGKVKDFVTSNAVAVGAAAAAAVVAVAAVAAAVTLSQGGGSQPAANDVVPPAAAPSTSSSAPPASSGSSPGSEPGTSSAPSGQPASAPQAPSATTAPAAEPSAGQAPSATGQSGPSSPAPNDQHPAALTKPSSDETTTSQPTSSAQPSSSPESSPPAEPTITPAPTSTPPPAPAPTPQPTSSPAPTATSAPTPTPTAGPTSTTRPTPTSGPTSTTQPTPTSTPTHTPQPPDLEPDVKFSLSTRKGRAPLTVTVDASGTTDAQGGTLTYFFDFGDSPGSGGLRPGRVAGFGTTLESGRDPIATHTYSAPGKYTLSVTVTDAQHHSATKTRTVTVEAEEPPPNQDPIANDQTATTAEDTPLTVTLSGTDPDGDTLTYSVASDPQHGTLSGKAPNLTYTPDPNYHGNDTFTFTVEDTAKHSDTGTITIDVTAVNDAPTADGLHFETDEDQQTVITLAGADVDGDELHYDIAGQPEHGTVADDPDSPNPAQVIYTPDPDFNGTDTFTYVANDGTNSNDGTSRSPETTVTINVAAVNDPPTTKDLHITTNEDTPVTVTLNGSDVDNNTLEFNITHEPEHGTVTDDPDSPNPAQVIYTPDPDFNGTDTFTYVAADGHATSDPATVKATVKSTPESVDLSLGLTPQNPKTHAVLHVGASTQTTENVVLHVHLSLPLAGVIEMQAPGWTCTRSLFDINCVHPPSSGFAPIALKWLPLDRLVTATAEIRVANNDDPNPTNNEVSWSLGGATIPSPR